MPTYEVLVMRLGQLVNVVQMTAKDALTAIDLVEAQYGDPPDVHSNGKSLIVTSWHGYEFQARRLDFVLS